MESSWIFLFSFFKRNLTLLTWECWTPNLSLTIAYFLYLVITQNCPLHFLLLRERQFLIWSVFLPLLLSPFLNELCLNPHPLFHFPCILCLLQNTPQNVCLVSSIDFWSLVLLFSFSLALDKNRSAFRWKVSRTPVDSKRMPLWSPNHPARSTLQLHRGRGSDRITLESTAMQMAASWNREAIAPCALAIFKTVSNSCFSSVLKII